MNLFMQCFMESSVNYIFCRIIKFWGVFIAGRFGFYVWWFWIVILPDFVCRINCNSLFFLMLLFSMFPHHLRFYKFSWLKSLSFMHHSLTGISVPSYIFQMEHKKTALSNVLSCHPYTSVNFSWYKWVEWRLFIHLTGRLYMNSVYQNKVLLCFGDSSC